MFREPVITVLRHRGTGTSTWSVPDPNVPVEDLAGVI
jgi:hypothetical protein